MTDLYSNLYTSDQTRALDRCAIDDFQIPGIELMERAGQAAFDRLRRRWPAAVRLQVFCGPGNNGGDGYVLGRLALQAGLQVTLNAIGGVPPSGREVALAAAAFAQVGRVNQGVPAVLPPDTHVTVDALLGTGLDRPVSGEMARAVAGINQWRHRGNGMVQALDIPTGLNADTGAVMGDCVRADQTVTFIGCNRGLVTGAARAYCGELILEPLGLPGELFDRVGSAARLGHMDGLLSHWLPRRSPIAHKGDSGRVLVIGGDHGYAGAPRLAGEAAQRSGAGLVTVVTRPEHVAGMVAGRPELMVRGFPGPAALSRLLPAADVVAIGPGLGQEDWGRELLDQVLKCDRPLVVDADGLNLLAKAPCRRPDWVLTPHPGEAARLLGETVAQIEADRFAAAERIATRYGGVVVLKGPGTLVTSAQESQTVVCPYGNAGLASGGSGDVLTGVVAGLVAQGVPLFQAALLGACAHGRAAEMATRRGERGTLASDLFAPLRSILNGLDGDDGAVGK
ncbi:MAG: NAD(P)H-hydrate dehydratase [Pseudomonadota bacterium]|nr:NAD(P)H-hydrate dehydratase [Pseudomonadota bacterium]